MSAVVDTQILLWYVLDSARLSTVAAAKLDEIAQSGEHVMVPTISLVEIEYLREKGAVAQAAYTRLHATLEDPAFAWKAAPLDLNVVASISRVPRETVPDMPDRIVTATAFALGLPLVSSDWRIRQVAGLEVVW